MKEITKVEKQFKNVNNQKISIPPPQKGLEFSGGGGSLRPNILKRGMKINWNFQKDRGGSEGMDTFWNYRW